VSYNEDETRFFLIDPILRDKGYGSIASTFDEAKDILGYTGYDTRDNGIAGHYASAMQAMDGVLAGLTLLGTNLVGLLAHDIALVEEWNGGPKVNLPTPTEFLELLANDPTGSEIVNYITLACLKYNPVTLAAEGLYHMSEALYRGNSEALRNASYEMLTLGLAVKWAETPAGKREMVLKTKQVDFIQQQMRRGIVERSPLKDVINEKPKPGETVTREFVVEKTDTGGSINVSVESYARATEGSLVRDPITGEIKVSRSACFTAGTLIHTEQGLFPIEYVFVGTPVLSKPEHSTEAGESDQGYHEVIKTVATLDQRVHAVQVKVEGEKKLTTLFPTHNHPFWVEDVVVDGAHWLAAECLESGMTLRLADGRKATVHANGLIRRTQHEGVGFAADEKSGVGIVLDLSAERLAVASDALVAHLKRSGQTLELGDPYLTTVYNFEVEETHTYYVGEAAVWVHNVNCDGVGEALKKEATERKLNPDELEASARKLAEDIDAMKKTCFYGETLVHGRWYGEPDLAQIQHLKPGMEVLSRCEETGELAYKRVTKVFAHKSQEVFHLSYHDKRIMCGGLLTVTANHPFWVTGKGWVNAIDLKEGDQFETIDGVSGTEFLRLEKPPYQIPVYNIEVEDFHTYFVETVNNGRGILVHNKDAKSLGEANAELPSGEALKNPKTGEPLKPAEIVAAYEKAALDAVENALRKVPENAGKKVDQYCAKLENDARNILGEKENTRPDALIDGRAADIYTPEGSNARNIADNITEKTWTQAHTIVLDLRNVKSGTVMAKEVVEALAQKTPPPDLRTLYIIEKNGQMFEVNYPATATNTPVYGMVDTATGKTIRLQVDETTGKPLPIDALTGKPLFDKATGKPLEGDVTTFIYNDNLPIIGAPLQVLSVGFSGLGAPQLEASTVQSLLPAARQYWLDVGAIAAQLDGIEFNIAPLTPRIVAMTSGSHITLSTDGAGWGWFADTTPAYHEEFAPGDAFNEFKAPTGSIADGKIDLLTVLIHEMGHAMGLNHVAGDDDVMVPYLIPGVRRLPTLDNIGMTLTSGSPLFNNAIMSYLLVINPTLLNGDFSTNDTNAWVAEMIEHGVVAA